MGTAGALAVLLLAGVVAVVGFMRAVLLDLVVPVGLVAGALKDDEDAEAVGADVDDEAAAEVDATAEEESC